MAEPNWEAWERILRQLQSDMTEVRRDVSELRGDMAEVRRQLSRHHVQIMHALGQTTDANLRAADTEDAVDDLRKVIEALSARVSKLEEA